MKAQHYAVVVSHLAEFSEAFSERLTPPYADEDARSAAETSVLNNVRMAYVNNDQIPIPRGTSAEGAVVHLMRQASGDVGIHGFDLASRYVGNEDLWFESVLLSGEHRSPFLLIEKENDFCVGVYALNAEELAPMIIGFTDDIRDTLEALATDHTGDKAVITFSIEIEDFEYDIEMQFRQSMTFTGLELDARGQVRVFQNGGEIG
jgi:hypothetical protein